MNAVTKSSGGFFSSKRESSSIKTEIVNQDTVKVIMQSNSDVPQIIAIDNGEFIIVVFAVAYLLNLTDLSRTQTSSVKCLNGVDLRNLFIQMKILHFVQNRTLIRQISKKNDLRS